MLLPTKLSQSLSYFPPQNVSFCILLYKTGTETVNYISPSLDGFPLGPIRKDTKKDRRKGERVSPSYYIFCFYQKVILPSISSVTGSSFFCYSLKYPSCGTLKATETSKCVFQKWYGCYSAINTMLSSLLKENGKLAIHGIQFHHS